MQASNIREKEEEEKEEEEEENQRKTPNPWFFFCLVKSELLCVSVPRVLFGGITSVPWGGGSLKLAKEAAGVCLCVCASLSLSLSVCVLRAFAPGGSVISPTG